MIRAMSGVFLALALAWLAGPGPAAGAEPPRIGAELRVEPLGDRAWRVVHERPWAANSLLVEMPDRRLVLCDTPYDDQATAELLGWIERRFGEREIVAVNSHFHADALGGNGALRAAGVVSHGSELTARLLAERGPAVHRQMLALLPEDLTARYAGAEWLPPERTFGLDAGLTLSFGDEPVEVFHPGPAHSPDNVVTWFPRRSLLFGGCLVRASPRLPNVADADLAGYPLAVERLRKLGAATLVPGHGRPGGPELLDVTLEAVAAQRDKR